MPPIAMYVDKIKITNFRNYKSQSLQLKDGINVFSGFNGMGKTNLLEAVYLSSIGKSARTPRDKELIMWEQPNARVSLNVQKDNGSEGVEIILSRSENKRVLINGMPASRLGELMGVVATVFFSPTELKIVQGSPSERRSFIDIAVCQISKAYFYLLMRYNKVLAQRNRLLKSGSLTDDILDIWDTQLASEGAKVIKTRKGFIKELVPLVSQHHSFLTVNNESAAIFYEGIAGEDTDEIKDNFLACLKKDRDKDKKFGYTHIGPHKDDLAIKINGVDIRTYGSQGQQRTAALSLKLAELNLNAKTKGEKPVLLLDDVLSELDIARRKRLLECVKGYQTIITCTHLEKDIEDSLCGEYVRFVVNNGAVMLPTVEAN